MVVVLPAPFEAEEARDLARLYRERQVVNGVRVAVSLTQASRLNH
jgi:hypothetical protein